MSRKGTTKMKGLKISSTRLHEIERNRTVSMGTEESLVDDLFGIESQNGHDGINGTGDASGNRKSKVKARIGDLEDKTLHDIFEYITAEADLKSLRLVSKRFNKVATEIFSNVHTPILLDSEDRLNDFTHDIDPVRCFNHPFSRYTLCLNPIRKQWLRTFAGGFNSKIKVLYIEPYESKRRTKFVEANVDEFPPRPVVDADQKLLWKLIEILEKLTDLEVLDIHFPTMSPFDYKSLEFDRRFDLKKLKSLTISFIKCGFCRFSSTLTTEIIQSADSLEKFRIRLPSPVNAITESRELEKVLRESHHLPSINIQLAIETARNPIIQTVCNAVTNGVNRRIKHCTLILEKYFKEFSGLNFILHSLGPILTSLNIYKRHRPHETPPNLSEFAPLFLPIMNNLQYLNIATHLIPIEPIERGTFPSLESLGMNLLYGIEQFYMSSVLDPLEKLKLEFHKTSIVKVMIPEEYLDNLISTHLKKLELVNPTAEHLTFMSDWGKQIETLNISCPFAYGEDPTYQVEKVLAQLRGDMQLRPGFYNSLECLPSVKVLRLLLPVDEATARYLASDSISRLYKIVLDDTLISKRTVEKLREKHHIYIPWRHLEACTRSISK